MFVSLQFKLELKRGDKEKLIKLMRKQSSGRNPEKGRVEKTILQSALRVLKVAPSFPIFGKVLRRDLSPLKPLSVQGAWDRVRSRLVPLSAGTVPIRDF
ncbi:hypothetical protein [Thermocrinis sp.]|jgi:hypothetical protein|uniref:hypothetical protein n=1 Tax=Thermocrinis sp. TaxID=2024383 RepID=UPI003BFC8DA8